MKTIAKAFAISALTVCAAGAAQAATVTTLTDLKMRSGPGTGYAAVATLPQGAQLHLGECSDDLHWCKVYWRGREGWASSHYLSEPGDAQPEVASRAPTYRRYDPPRRPAYQPRRPAYQEYPDAGDVLIGPADSPSARPRVYFEYGVRTRRWSYD